MPDRRVAASYRFWILANCASGTINQIVGGATNMNPAQKIAWANHLMLATVAQRIERQDTSI